MSPMGYTSLSCFFEELIYIVCLQSVGLSWTTHTVLTANLKDTSSHCLPARQLACLTHHVLLLTTTMTIVYVSSAGY